MQSHDTANLASRFWKYVEKRGEDECWPWTGWKNREGRGDIRLPGKDGGRKKATHVMWFLTHGVWPTHQMLHHCDNPNCMNPAHLFDGTTQDNTADRTAKGRSARGESHGVSKLTEDKVKEIRERCAYGENQRSVARRFGISQGTVGFIVRRETWRHI